MDIVEKYLPVAMFCGNLDSVPEYPLPPEFRLKWYGPGDEHRWVELYSRSEKFQEITLDLYRDNFGTDGKLLSERQFFILDSSGGYVGTTTAWFKDIEKDRATGRIHWVAVVPECQGRGLSRPIMSIAMRRLRDLGHRSAYLVTHTSRIAAINLYLKFGFVPCIEDEGQTVIWEQLAKFAKYPVQIRKHISQEAAKPQR